MFSEEIIKSNLAFIRISLPYSPYQTFDLPVQTDQKVPERFIASVPLKLSQNEINGIKYFFEKTHRIPKYNTKALKQWYNSILIYLSKLYPNLPKEELLIQYETDIRKGLV